MLPVIEPVNDLVGVTQLVPVVVVVARTGDDDVIALIATSDDEAGRESVVRLALTIIRSVRMLGRRTPVLTWTH